VRTLLQRPSATIEEVFISPKKEVGFTEEERAQELKAAERADKAASTQRKPLDKATQWLYVSKWVELRNRKIALFHSATISAGRPGQARSIEWPISP